MKVVKTGVVGIFPACLKLCHDFFRDVMLYEV